MNIRSLSSWNRLEELSALYSSIRLPNLFANDPRRFEKFSRSSGDIIVDFSKQRINSEIMQTLAEFLSERKFDQEREAMFSGKAINNTEGRSALHTALRRMDETPVFSADEDVMPDVRRVRKQMKDFTEKIHSKSLVGRTGKPFTHVVNIGIGGSDLGPKMVCEALAGFCRPDIVVRFVSNVDSAHIVETLRDCPPDTTLFLIASKTFTTEETMTNAHTARRWFLEKGALEQDVRLHFAALSTNIAATSAFGIDPVNVFAFWDWVGGRFSLWSSVGLSIALAVGYDNFECLLEGAYEADSHFRQNPPLENIPVTMALIDFWNVNFLGAKSHAILPYDEHLRSLPAFLQQLEMESNGKYIQKDGEKTAWQTCPVVWGEPGTDSQHSFFQLLHQGTEVIPCDFIAAAQPHWEVGEHHDRLLANFFAQTEALMNGKNIAVVRAELDGMGMREEQIRTIAPHKVFEGNRPTTTILLKKLTPKTLGTLLAWYEHKVFTLGVLWNVNSFDQWGVELGKQLAKRIYPELFESIPPTAHDSSTNGLIAAVQRWRNR